MSTSKMPKKTTTPEPATGAVHRSVTSDLGAGAVCVTPDAHAPVICWAVASVGASSPALAPDVKCVPTDACVPLKPLMTKPPSPTLPTGATSSAYVCPPTYAATGTPACWRLKAHGADADNPKLTTACPVGASVHAVNPVGCGEEELMRRRRRQGFRTARPISHHASGRTSTTSHCLSARAASRHLFRSCGTQTQRGLKRRFHPHPRSHMRSCLIEESGEL